MSTLKLATLTGVVALLAFAVGNQWRLGELEERLGDRIRDVERRVETGGAAATAAVPAVPPPGVDTDLPPLATPDWAGFVGVAPVPDEKPDAERRYVVDVAGAPSKGPPDAPVTLVDFSSFQCGFCKMALEPLARIEEVYGDQVRIVWKNLPLAIHGDAPGAHLAAMAAARQGAFWEFHDRLFAAQDSLDRGTYRLYATELGLDLERFEADMADDSLRQAIQTDMEEARSMALTATPGFFVNGRYIRGFKPFEVFAEMINEELAKAGEPIPVAAR